MSVSPGHRDAQLERDGAALLGKGPQTAVGVPGARGRVSPPCHLFQHNSRDAEMPARRFPRREFISLLPLPTVALCPRPGGNEERGAGLGLPALSEQETEMSLWKGNAVSLRCNRLSR